MSIVKTENLTIGNFLRNTQLRIPPFQRPYKWSVQNTFQLLDDIQRFKGSPSYRIGSIIVLQEEGVFKIVDGQQRTITFLLIVEAILKVRYQQITIPELKRTLDIIKKNAAVHTFQNDISKANIQRNFREICRHEDLLDEKYIDFFLNKCQVTWFVLDNISEAFQFFDSQNARGKDLEPHDLLKAFHLRELNAPPRGPSEEAIARLVDTWEGTATKQLALLFSDFLFRVRGWSKGDSSRYFTKRNTPLFKGITLSKIGDYPYAQLYKMLDSHLRQPDDPTNKPHFPFQLDQVIINGEYFFEMVTHYQRIASRLKDDLSKLPEPAKTIIDTLDTYEGRNRTGDKYVRMLFDCALLYYIDKFGKTELKKVIPKLFIWAYTIRLNRQNLQMASVDNYVTSEFNMFKHIREAIYKEQIQSLELGLIQNDKSTEKTEEIKTLFIRMKYYANA